MIGDVVVTVRAEYEHRHGSCVAVLERSGSPCEADARYWVGRVPLCRLHFEPVVQVATDAVERERARLADARAEQEVHDQAADYASVVAWSQSPEPRTDTGSPSTRTVRQVFADVIRAVKAQYRQDHPEERTAP